MGTMSNKVTRRIALGSLAGGLGGAALVLRALKGRYEVDVPEGGNPVSIEENYYKNVRPPKYEKKDVAAYGEEWRHDRHMVDVSIENIQDPLSVNLKFKRETGFDFNVFSITANYITKLAKGAKYPQPPSWYSVMNGRVTSVDPVEDSKLALLLRAGQMLTKSQYFQRELPGGECILVPDHFSRDYYEMVQNVPKKLGIASLNIPCSDLGAWLTFRYPTGTVVAKGTKWMNPEIAETYDGGMSCEVIGFAEVAGRQAVKIRAERQQICQSARVAIAMGSKKNCSHKQLEERAKQHLDKAKQEEPAESLGTFQIVAYVDLASGITLRQEYVAEGQSETRVTITQVLDG